MADSVRLSAVFINDKWFKGLTKNEKYHYDILAIKKENDKDGILRYSYIFIEK